jgi:hypothetical protein
MFVWEHAELQGRVFGLSRRPRLRRDAAGGCGAVAAAARPGRVRREIEQLRRISTS